MKLTEVFAKQTYRKRIPRLPNETYKQLPKVGQWVALLLTFEEGDIEPHFMTGQVRERDDNQITLELNEAQYAVMEKLPATLGSMDMKEAILIASSYMQLLGYG